MAGYAPGMTTNVTHSTDVAVPVGTAYNQWTQFTSFPQFMDGVERIDQLTPTRTHWVTNIAGVRREFDAEITEQHPDERVAWKTENGTHQAGVVTFHRLDNARTRVTLQLDHDPRASSRRRATRWASCSTGSRATWRTSGSSSRGAAAKRAVGAATSTPPRRRADPGPAHLKSASTASCALRAAISTGSHTGENGGA